MKTLSETSIDDVLESEALFSGALDYAEAFTACYSECDGLPADAREAVLLKRQFAVQFVPVIQGDSFAGRVRYPLVGLSPQPVGLGYYCAFQGLEKGADKFPNLGKRAREISAFWENRSTQARVRAALPDWVQERIPSDNWTVESGVGFPLYRMAGVNLDYVRLFELGLDGLEAASAGSLFSHVVPLLRATIDRYCAETADEKIVRSLCAVRNRPPQHFREAIQLFWLYVLHAGTWDYGRLDVALGPFLVKDLAAGVLTEGEALDLLCALYRQMHDAYSNQYDNRIFIGGKGRPDEAVADRFALLAIEAIRRVKLNQPQLSLRFYEGQNPELWERALDAIGEGCTFPMLYNDDVNIPAVAKAFRVEEDLAAQYTPYGCGEYVLSHFSVGPPNGVINLLKALEAALHGGMDPVSGQRVAEVPPAEQFSSFEDVWAAYCRVVEPYVDALAVFQKVQYDVMAQEAPLGFISLLVTGCLERNLSAFGGGTLHLGGSLETYGNINTSDSLHVIDELVFRRKEITLPELIAALDADFKGCEALHKKCRSVAKYGNDEPTVDAMAQRVHTHICCYTRDQAVRAGLDSYLVVEINNWANTLFGFVTSASPDGRLYGQPMANANNPSPGSDGSGVTAFLNSLVKMDPAIHAGAVQNMKFSKEWFGRMRPKFDALLRSYFLKGGTQAMITVVSKDDLSAAMRNPEHWGHLIVRVGGFSIRFIDLPREAQLEVLHRTLN